MPTNEAGLSEGHDMGAGGDTDASDMPGGERNDGPTSEAPEPDDSEAEQDGGGI